MRIVTWCLCVFGLGACDPVPPGALDDLDFPDGFQLDARAEVTVRLSSARPDADAAAVSVQLPDGTPLLEARLGDVLDVPVTLKLLPDVTEVLVLVRTDDGDEQVVTGAVRDGRVDVEVP